MPCMTPNFVFYLPRESRGVEEALTHKKIFLGSYTSYNAYLRWSDPVSGGHTCMTFKVIQIRRMPSDLRVQGQFCMTPRELSQVERFSAFRGRLYPFVQVRARSGSFVTQCCT